MIVHTSALSVLSYFLSALAIGLTAFHIWFQSLRSTKLGNKIPGPFALPIIGNALVGIGKSPADLLAYCHRVKQKSGNVVRIWIGTRLGVALGDPRDIELILGSHEHLEKPFEYSFFKPWLGDGLLISSGEKWRSHRKMIAPTFHSSILKTFIPVYNENAFKLVDSLRKEIGRVFDVHDYMSGTTVDTLLETAMGVKKTKDDNTGYEYAMAVMDMCNILHIRHYKLWLRPDFIFNLTGFAKQQEKFINIIHSLTNKVLKRKKVDYFERKRAGEESLYKKAVEKAEFESEGDEKSSTVHNGGHDVKDDLDEQDESDIGEKKRLAFLDFMIEAGQNKNNNLSDVEIKEEVDTIMFEGHDTVAAASSFFLCMMACHPEIQEKVLQELDEIFQGSQRPVTFNDTVQMKYLERTIFETLRMYPPVPAIGRVLAHDVRLASAPYLVPKGTSVAVATIILHRDPQYYPNPDKFDPDRFLPERCQERHFYSFIPFSAGPRSCVGRKYAMLKLKVILSHVLRNFRIVNVVDEKDFELQADIILKRADGFRIKIEERKKHC